MNPASSRRAFLLSSAAALAVGCRIQRRALERRTFLLQPPESRPVPEVAPAGVLLVRPFGVTTAYESRSFIIRQGESEFVADPYHAFLLSPGPMITEALAEWIRGLSIFQAVITGGSHTTPTHALEGDITALYGDYRDPARPAAHLEVELRLFHPLAGRDSPLLWTGGRRRSMPMERTGADELVAAWNLGLAGICADLLPGLLEAAAGAA